MMRKIAIPGVFLLVMCCVMASLLFSGLGLQVTLRIVSTLTDDAVTVEKSRGRIMGRWEVEGLRLKNADTDILIQRLLFNWHPIELLRGKLFISELLVDGAEMVLADQVSEVAAGTREFQLPEISLPIPFLVEQARINTFSLSRPGGKKIFALEYSQAAFSGGGNSLLIDGMVIRVPGYEVSMRGRLDFYGDWPLVGSGSWKVDQGECSEMTGTFGMKGPLESPLLTVSMEEPGKVEIQGALEQLFTDLRWKLDGSASELYLPDVCADLPDLSIGLQISAEGEVTDYSGQLRGDFSFSGFPSAAAVLSLHGDGDGLTIDKGTIDVEESQGYLTGAFSWKDALTWNGQFEVKGFDLSAFGEVATGVVDLEAAVQGQMVDQILSYEASLSHLVATFDDLGKSLTGNMRLRGDESGIDILGAQIEAEGGLIELLGRMGWHGGINWNAQARFEGINPSRWMASPEGQLNGKLLSTGKLVGDETAFQASLVSSSSVLAGYPLEMDGRVGYSSGILAIDGLTIATGLNRVEVEGAVGEIFDVKFMVDGRDLSQLHEHARGQVDIAGSLRGTRAKPIVRLSASAKEAAFLDYSLAELGMSATIDGGESIDAAVDLQGLRISDKIVEAVHGAVTGKVDDHAFTLTVTSEVGNIAAEGAGKLNKMAHWTGTISALRYDHSSYGVVQLENAARATVSSTSFSLEDFCIASSGSRVCSAVSWESSGPWHAGLTNIQLNLSELTSSGLVPLPIEGEMRGDLEINGAGTVVESGRGRFVVPELRVEPPEETLDEALRWTDTELTLDISNQTLDASYSALFLDGSPLQVKLSIGEFGDLSIPFATLPLHGALNWDIADLTLFKPLTGDDVVLAGHLNSDINVSGTLLKPEIEGELSLKDGGAALPDLGVHLTDIAFALKGDENNLAVSLAAQSGEGQLTGEGGVAFQNNSWEGRLDIVGHDLTLLDQSEMELTGNPDMQLTINPQGARLTGNLKIPRARIEPEEMVSAESQSRDTVFVDLTEETRSAFPFRFNIDVDLGDDIQIEGYGFSGGLNGNLNVIGSGTGEIRGRGELRVRDGTFSLRGSSLDISRGVIVFNGGPIDNPTLNIQARRVISQQSSSSQQVLVGVNITGTVKDYYLELFSVPEMEDREILAYILSDRPFAPGDDSSDGMLDSVLRMLGVAGGNNLLERVGRRLPVDQLNIKKGGDNDNVSLVVGRQITDRVSVGYDFNLFEDGGQLRIRYSFLEGFSFEVKNSVDATGVELLYSIER